MNEFFAHFEIWQSFTGKFVFSKNKKLTILGTFEVEICITSTRRKYSENIKINNKLLHAIWLRKSPKNVENHFFQNKSIFSTPKELWIQTLRHISFLGDSGANPLFLPDSKFFEKSLKSWKYIEKLKVFIFALEVFWKALDVIWEPYERAEDDQSRIKRWKKSICFGKNDFRHFWEISGARLHIVAFRWFWCFYCNFALWKCYKFML